MMGPGRDLSPPAPREAQHRLPWGTVTGLTAEAVLEGTWAVPRCVRVCVCVCARVGGSVRASVCQRDITPRCFADGGR